MRFITRPLPPIWPSGQRTPAAERQWGRFRALWGSTMELLERELLHLDAVEPVVIEAGYEPRHIRLDGAPYANARPSDPAVIVSFGSRLGPLRYACDAYHEHAANLRAIALTLEALRAVDRYRVTKRAEQYRGFQALPPSGEPGMSRAEAEAFIRHHGANGEDVNLDLPLGVLYRRAAKRLHPDAGGDPAEWMKLDRAARAVGL